MAALTPPPEGTPTGTVLLEVAGVSLAFGGLVVLDDVSFAARTDEVLALIGPNGAGKTSLFNVLTRAYAPQQGSVTLHTPDGPLDVLRTPAHQLVSRGLARTFQNMQLTPELTVVDNVLVGRHHMMRAGVLANIIRFGRSSAEERAHEEICRDTLAFLGLHAEADRRVETLPYGLRKKVELARALATRPRVLLLDEPAAGLDDEETDEMAGILHALRDTGTCTPVLIEHDVRMVMETADRIVALNFGKVLVEGTAAEVGTHPEVLASYLGTK